MEFLDEDVREAERWVLETEEALRAARTVLRVRRAVRKLNARGLEGSRARLSERELHLIQQYSAGELAELQALERKAQQKRIAEFRALLPPPEQKRVTPVRLLPSPEAPRSRRTKARK
jgi:hypothetical protein